MPMLVCDSDMVEELKAERQAAGSDRYDEVWEGVYLLMPLPDDEHQALISALITVLQLTIGWTKLGAVYPGINVSDRTEGWEHNYRCPDVAVYLKGTQAQPCRTHWVGGPDFGIEIISPNDRTRDKLDFYASVGTRERLVIDRDPWSLELYRLRGKQLVLAGTSSLEQTAVLTSEALPLSWRLALGDARPQIEIIHTDGQQRWTV
jgi:Uma2 family endonuclease